MALPSTRLLDLAAFQDALESLRAPADSDVRPLVLRIGADELDQLAQLSRDLHITMIDQIERQLADLALVRFPAHAHAPDRRAFIENAIRDAGGLAAVGNWVYVPWEAKLVHLLDRDAYFEVITNRNINKVTAAEQRTLRTKRIGVIGLSVGGEAAVTLAQEHLCGEIVLADFDRLDLSNLNRLNAGFDDLGHNKAVIVARRIAKINPYLPVTVYVDGVTAESLPGFLEGLDLLVEECDNLEIKREVRRQAKARRLNVVYAADERGFLSVEPYASWPELEAFHGQALNPEVRREAFPTPQAFFRALTAWMGGWDQISERSRRSLGHVGETLCGYPQLASEARFAAGQIGHVARRLLLGDQVLPFLGHIDLTEFLPSAPPTASGGTEARPAGSITTRTQP